jgi:hypothetical protein
MRSDWVGAPLCRLYSLDHVHHQVRKVSAATSASGRAPAYGRFRHRLLSPDKLRSRAARTSGAHAGTSVPSYTQENRLTTHPSPWADLSRREIRWLAYEA